MKNRVFDVISLAAEDELMTRVSHPAFEKISKGSIDVIVAAPNHRNNHRNNNGNSTTIVIDRRSSSNMLLKNNNNNTSVYSNIDYAHAHLIDFS